MSLLNKKNRKYFLKMTILFALSSVFFCGVGQAVCPPDYPIATSNGRACCKAQNNDCKLNKGMPCTSDDKCLSNHCGSPITTCK